MIKELEEAEKKVVKILSEIVSLVQTGTMLHHHFGKGLGDTKTIAEYARQILNLKGDGWHWAILSDKKAIYHKGYFPVVIWEAE